MNRFMADTALRKDYQVASKRVLPHAWGGFDHKAWAERYAHQEHDLEEALGGICWDYPDRPIVAATALLLENLAGIDLHNPTAYRKTVADGFRQVADMIEESTRA